MSRSNQRHLTPAEWLLARHLHTGKEDKFAGTFQAKANAMKLWPTAVGIYNDAGHVKAGIIIRVSKRQPYVANLQLLHTFNSFRRQGLARKLVEEEFARVRVIAAYFRVSAEEDAVPFYRSLGFKFWGRQKSGSYLSMFKIAGTTISEGTYDNSDPAINKAIYTKARGGLVEVFDGGAQ